jgi:hypothetical protein
MEVMLFDVDQQDRYGNEFSSLGFLEEDAERISPPAILRPPIPPGTASWGKSGCDATTIEKVCTYTAALVFRYYQSDILQNRELPGFTIFDKTSVMATESDAVLKQVFRDFINGCHILHYHRYVNHEQTNN